MKKNFHDWFGTNDIRYMLTTTCIAFLSGFLPSMLFFLDNIDGGDITREALWSAVMGAFVSGTHIVLKVLSAIVATRYSQIITKQPVEPEIAITTPENE